MIRAGSLLAAILLVLALTPAVLADGPDGKRKGKGKPKAERPEGLTELVHVPIEELDVLLKQGRQGIVLRYGEYRQLVEAARARADLLAAEPPVDGTLMTASGSVDLTRKRAATLDVAYDVRVLADGPRSIPFPLRHLAVESIELDGGGRYEELEGRPRLRFDGPGERTVRVRGSSAYATKGDQRLFQVRFPPASAMYVNLRFPGGFDGVVAGEGANIQLDAQSDVRVVRVRPALSGWLRVAFAPASKGSAGPPILDGRSHGVHNVGDGIVTSDFVVEADVFRTAVTALTLLLPADVAVHDVSGDGVVGFRRSDDRTRLVVDLAAAKLGRVGVKLRAERAYQPESGIALPRVILEGAVRHRSQVAVRFGPDVQVHAVTPNGGRRLPALADPQWHGVLRYALAGEDAQVVLDLEPGATRLEAVSTYYLNLAESGKTLLATTTYKVIEGTVFALRPTFPKGYELRELTIGGRTDGFRRDLREDGTLEITLDHGVPTDGEIRLLATLDEAEADWLPETATQRVAFPVPSAGVDRQDGIVAVGADATFQVLETATAGLVAIGAGDLTARGIDAAGLVYGYRIDGKEPALALDVRRHTPRLAATIVTAVTPTPRRLMAYATVIHTIERAGVRLLEVDVPEWTGDDVQFDTPFLRAANPIRTDVPDDVPAGYVRWRVSLAQRVIGRHVMGVGFHLDQDQEDWRIPGTRALCVRAPLKHAERMLVVHRAQGLEVQTEPGDADARALDITELPIEAAVDPMQVLDVVRLSNGTNGIPIAVRKHGGAAVLDLIATDVRIETAVAMEGVLRSRADVVLFNVGRQFLPVVLPSGSELIGAIVDEKPVKPLARGDGTLLIPIPTANGPGERSVVALTWETALDGAVEGEVEIAGPRFPQVEVLSTVHTVGFEPDVEILAVHGDLAGRVRVAGRGREPWILAALEAPAAMSATEASRLDSNAAHEFQGISDGPVIKDYDVETANELPYDESFDSEAATPDLARSNTATATNRGTRRAAANEPAERGPTGPTTGAQPNADPSPLDDAMSDMPAPTPLPGATPSRPPGARFPADPGTTEGHGAGGPPQPGGEGPTFTPQPTRAPRAGLRRKGLLSLDVPVWLEPNNRIATHRLGQGGTMTIEIDRKDDDGKAYLALLIAFVAMGLGVGLRGRAWRWSYVLGAIAVGALAYVLGGDDASSFVCASVDAATALSVMYGLRSLAVRLTGGTAKTAAASLVVAFVLGALAPAAYADEPRPPTPNVKDPDTLYLPYDPAKPGEIADADKVFLPLDAYLALYKAAHPEADPEVVELGRYVTLVDAHYEVAVGRELAEATFTWRLAKRGGGMKLVSLPLAGLSVVEATLDGAPVRLLLDQGLYRVALEREGDHELVLRGRLPIVRAADVRTLAFQVPAFARARLDVADPGFRGEMRVNGAGRVVQASTADDATGWSARAWLGRTHDVAVRLVDPLPDALPETVVTRAEMSTVFSVRDDGTETQTRVTLHVLQGQAPFVDLDLPKAERVLEAQGSGVVSWQPLENAPNRVRLTFQTPTRGTVELFLRTFHEATAGDRDELLEGPTVVGATGESGRVVVNADAGARVVVLDAPGLFRVGRPGTKDAAGPDGLGRVVAAWTFAAQYPGLSVRVEPAEPRIEIESVLAVVFGDDRVRSRFDALVGIQRRSVGHLVFDLPGTDEVRGVDSAGLLDWWLVGDGDERALHLRYDNLKGGDVAIRVHLERRLGGVVDGIAVPRFVLRGAHRDRGRVILYSLPEIEPSTGAVAGLRSIPLTRANPPASHVARARPVSAFVWERPIAGALPVVLRAPDLEVRSTSVTLVSPGDEEHKLEHLLLYDVRRGALDRLRFFLPDGGNPKSHVVRTRDLREMREERVTRTGADGQDVAGTLYDIRLQSPHGGIVAVTCSQVWDTGRPVRFVEPEGVAETRSFMLVRTFLDGEVETETIAGRPEDAVWADLPFVPTGFDRSAIVSIYDARDPFVLGVKATRHKLEEQADAVVQAAIANVVVGRDGYARVRVSYRVFNRGRQFLRLDLPDGAQLFGATVGGRPVKPLGGAGANEILVPVPKVPVGGTGQLISVLYRARIGPDVDDGGALTLVLPEVPGVDVDRTVVQLYVPDGYAYDFDTDMAEAVHADVAADLAEAALREARNLLQIAEKGTLEQRFLSATNVEALLQEAEVLAQQEAVQIERPTLQEDVAALKAQCAMVCFSAKSDWKAAQEGDRSLNPSQLEFGGNAANLIESDGGRADREEDQRQNRAGWVFNDAEVSKSKQKDTGALKKQIVEQLLEQEKEAGDKRKASAALARGQSEAQQNDQSRAVLGAEVRRNIQGQEQSLVQLEDVTNGLEDASSAGYDAKNFGALNARLRHAQAESNQIGAAPGVMAPDDGRPQQSGAGQTFRYQQGLAPGSNSSSGGGGGGANSVAGQGTADNLIGYTDIYNSHFVGGAYFRRNSLDVSGDGTILAPRSGSEDGASNDAGIFYNDGQDRNYSARVENLFDEALGRAGLMGVDVPLPRAGKVYFFRSLRAGAPIRFEASKTSPTPDGAGFAIIVLLLAAAGIVIIALRARKQAA